MNSRHFRPAQQYLKRNASQLVKQGVTHYMASTSVLLYGVLQKQPISTAYRLSTKAQCSSSSTTPSTVLPPLVVLYGWLGSKDKYLRKYSQVWEDNGCQCILHCPSILTTGIPILASLQAEHVSKLVRQETQVGDRVIIHHVFSNAGFLLFNQILRSVDKSTNFENTNKFKRVYHNPDGIVFDSCPGRINSRIATSGTLAALLSVSSQDLQSSVLRPFVRAFVEAFLNIPLIQTGYDEVFDTWAQSPPQAPQLFLHSKLDKVIPHEAVQSFQLDQQKQILNMSLDDENRKFSIYNQDIFSQEERMHLKSGDVIDIAFDTGSHCELLRTHNQLYRTYIKQFLQSIQQQHESQGKDEG